MHPVLQDFANYYRASGASPHTIRLRMQTMRLLMVHAQQPDPLTVTSRHIVAWLAGLQSPRTRATYRVSVKQFFDWALLYGLIFENPMLLVPKVRSQPAQPRPLPVPLILDAITSARSWRTRAYLVLGLYAGLRVHEIAKVHSDDVDIVTRTLFVRGKGRVEAYLPMHSTICVLAVAKAGSGFWFPSGSPSGHVHASSVSRTIKAALVAAGAPVSAHAHMLRHTYITALFGATSNARVVQELARHASLNTTQIYAGVQREAMRAAIGKLSA